MSLGERFIAEGYVIQLSEERSALDAIRLKTATAAAQHLNLTLPNDINHFLNHIHECVDAYKLNDLRLAVLNTLLGDGEFRELYFSCARRLIEDVVGNELAMQRNIGFSIQLPNDDSSLLPLHSDSWGSECSPFETVLWIPLVDCAKTKSMFFLPPERDLVWRKRVPEFEKTGIEALYKAVESELTWLDIKYGEVLLFTPTMMHGNRVNREATTRWSFNVRFKGLFTPYAGKKLGEYFAPLSIRPASRVGLSFEMPALDGGGK